MKYLPYITDRSRIVAREECPRSRYLGYDLKLPTRDIRGIQRTSISLPLLDGIEDHEAHARLFKGDSIKDIITDMKVRYVAVVKKRGIFKVKDEETLRVMTEQLALLEGALRTFERIWLPRLLDEYDVVNIEQSHDWELAPNLRQKLRFDVLLRRKADGQLVIMDYKTMGYVSDGWNLKHEHSRQTSLYTQAAEEIYGEPVDMGYIGVVKGKRTKDTAQSSPFKDQVIQYSPYCYAYVLRNGEVGNVYQTAYTNKKGYVKFRTYDEMPMVEWVDWLFENERPMVNELFVFIPPFAPTLDDRRRAKMLAIREELEWVEKLEHYETLKARAMREGNLQLLQQAQDYLDFVFAPMREEVCPKYGPEYICQFDGICHNQGALENVIAGEDPAFESREPHHETTVEK